jgi:transcriptional regulator of met regulon
MEDGEPAAPAQKEGDKVADRQSEIEELERQALELNRRRHILEDEERRERLEISRKALEMEDVAEAFNGWWQAQPYASDMQRRKAGREAVLALHATGVAWCEFDPEALRHAISFLHAYTRPKDMPPYYHLAANREPRV